MRLGVRLTGRGRGVVLSGAVLLVVGAVAGSFVLVAAGLFAALVAALSVAWGLVRRSRARISRTEVPALLRNGEQFAATAVLDGDGGPAAVSGLTPGWAVADDTAGASFLVRTDGRRSLRQMCTAGSRGVFGWPPLSLELPDPLGCVHGLVGEPSPGTTVVLPRTEAVAELRLPASPGGAAETEDAPVSGRHPVGDAGASSVPRPFRSGDQLRRMHWPATARSGDPMVRADDPAPVRQAIVLLDLGRDGYGTSEGFERAVTAAASICARLLELGWSVSLRDASGAFMVRSGWASGARGRAELLAALAAVQPGERPPRQAPRPTDPAVAYAVTGCGPEPRWAQPPLNLLRVEPGADPVAGLLLWDGSVPLSSALVADSLRAGA